MRPTRRGFLRTTGVGLGLSAWQGLRDAGAQRPVQAPERIHFGPDLEPIVRLIEDTPRDRVVDILVEQLRRGLPYRRFLAAIFLTAVRKRDSHHSVYLVHSAHQISMDLRPEERLLPLFWAVDHYKWQQERFPTPAMAPLTGPLPAADKAAAEFQTAMNGRDSERAERALVALARSQGVRQVIEQLWPYGGRDVSFIGHRAIVVSSCARVLEVIGLQHAEPVLRFVVQDLLLRGGGPDSYSRPNTLRADRLLDKLPADWASGRADRGATLELFALMRTGRSEPACELAAKQLAGGTGAQAIWDAVHVAAAELLILHNSNSGMHQRPLHVNTAANALHHSFDAAQSSRTRLVNLLQAVAWVGDFLRVQLAGRKFNDTRMTDLEGVRLSGSPAETVDDIFSSLPPRTHGDPKTGVTAGHFLVNRAARMEPSRKVFALLTQHPEATSLYQQAALNWLAVKATVEAHEYKLPNALFEDCDLVSPEWRPRLMAASAHWLHGRQSADSVVAQRARQALR